MSETPANRPLSRDTALSFIAGKLARMVPPVSGGCACGAFRYTCTSAPFFSCNCHCRACQRLSGAPFVSAFNVVATAFQTNNAAVVSFTRKADSLHEVTTRSCAQCGTRLFAQSDGNRAFVGIFAATLDDPAIFSPAANVYVAEAAPWTRVDETLLSFRRMPPKPA